MQVERNVMGGLFAIIAICLLAVMTAHFLH